MEPEGHPTVNFHPDLQAYVRELIQNELQEAMSAASTSKQAVSELTAAKKPKTKVSRKTRLTACEAMPSSGLSSDASQDDEANPVELPSSPDMIEVTDNTKTNNNYIAPDFEFLVKNYLDESIKYWAKDIRGDNPFHQLENYSRHMQKGYDKRFSEVMDCLGYPVFHSWKIWRNTPAGGVLAQIITKIVKSYVTKKEYPRALKDFTVIVMKTPTYRKKFASIAGVTKAEWEFKRKHLTQDYLDELSREKRRRTEFQSSCYRSLTI